MEGPISSRNQDRHATPVDPSPESPSRAIGRGLHTPGPLEAVGRSIRAEVGKSGYRGQGFDIAQTLGSVGDAEADANARLYAAAPDYYDAAEAIRSYVVTSELVGERDPLRVPMHLMQALLRAHKKADPAGYRKAGLVAGKVNRPAVPEGRDTHATDIEFTTDIAGAGENDGSLQHTPTTWVGNELVNRQVGGAE